MKAVAFFFSGNDFIACTKTDSVSERAGMIQNVHKIQSHAKSFPEANRPTLYTEYYYCCHSSALFLVWVA